MPILANLRGSLCFFYLQEKPEEEDVDQEDDEDDEDDDLFKTGYADAIVRYVYR